MPPKAMLKGAVPTEVVLKVMGNWFVPEMRTVCALLELNEIPYECQIMDIFSDDGRQDYRGFNPS